ncbi:Hint domain-containing protein [Jannaschia sp. S6380]|uniref:Hint domain-containing protein n=1 Tax=Jannaschia sp. S6380 TaxID=2926408 RepID=UPI001FF10C97|nr:Hint domain-containing protein [Jannaschia sp. S6380]MCK0167177.1 Hint domain-containing protein [Jannaschia sp. S6380]
MAVQLRQNAESLARTGAAPVMAAPRSFKGGIAGGTVIRTARGEIPVEALTSGDRIATRERGMAVLTGVQRLTAPACAIRTDSLGLGRPERHTTVTACQHVTVRDWRAEALFDMGAALVPACRLADGRQIAAFGNAEFYRLTFDAPLTIYANGLEMPTGRTETGVVEMVDGED